MRENVNWTLRGQPVLEQDDQPHQGPTVNTDGNTRPINILKLFFTGEQFSRVDKQQLCPTTAA